MQGLFKNEFEVLFKVFSEQQIGNKQGKLEYRCMSCGKKYKSKNGAKNHKCSIKLNELCNFFTMSNYSLAIENLLRFVCTSNISLRSLDNSYLRNAFKNANYGFEFPLRDTLKKEMDELAMKIQCDMYQKLRNQSVSILFDSCTRWKRNFQGIIIFSQMRLFLYSIVETANSKAQTIKSIVDDAVTELKGFNISVISICTDNCNTNKSAFDHQHIYRQPCSAHTMAIIKSLMICMFY